MMTLGAGRLKERLHEVQGSHPIGDMQGMGGLLFSTPGTSGPAYPDARTTRDVYDAHAFERRAAPF